MTAFALSHASRSRAAAKVLPIGLGALFVLLATPLFVRLGGPTLIGPPETATVRVGGFTLPVGALLCVGVAALLALVRWRARADRIRSPFDRAILVFLAISVVVLAFRLLDRPGAFNLLYFAQTVGPLTAYYVTSRLVRSGGQADQIVRTVGAAGVASGAALLISTAAEGGGPAALLHGQLTNHVGPLNIYQSNDYVPFVLAIVLLFTLFGLVARERLGVAAIALLFVLAIVVLASYARGPVLVLLAGSAVMVAATWRRSRPFTLRGVGVLSAAFAVAIVLGFPSVARVTVMVGSVAAGLGVPTPLSALAPTSGPSAGPGATTVAPRASSRPSAAPGSGTSGPASPASVAASPVAEPSPAGLAAALEAAAGVDSSSNETRLKATMIAAGFLARHPLLGSGFAPIPREELATDIGELAPTQLFTAHNQYLDLGLRGGLALLLSFLSVMVVVGRSSWRLATRSEEGAVRAFAGALGTIVVATLVVGNMYQHNFTQPFSGFLLWALIGAVAGLESAGVAGRASRPRAS